MFEPAASTIAVFIDFILKGFFILLLAVAADIIFNKANASLRHLIWIIALTAILVLPIFSPLIPQLDIPLLNFLLIQGSVPETSGPIDSELFDHSSRGFGLSASNLFLIAFGIYIIGVVAVFVWQLSGRVHAIKMRGDASEADNDAARSLHADVLMELNIGSDVALLVSHTASAPFSIGILKPAIILPKCAYLWPRSITKSVLIHEAAHIKRMDLLSRGIAQLACCINWFNPLAWFGFRRLLIEQEIACDNYVLSAGSKPSEYAQSLLAVANVKRSMLDYALAAIGRKRELKDRLMEILKPKRSKNPLKGSRFTIFLFLALMLLLPIFILNIWYNKPAVQAYPAEKESLNKQQTSHTKKPTTTHASKPEKPLTDKTKDTAEVEKITKEEIMKKITAMKEKGYSEEEINKFLEETKKRMELEQNKLKKSSEKTEVSEKDSSAKQKAAEEEKVKKQKEKDNKNKPSEGGAK